MLSRHTRPTNSEARDINNTDTPCSEFLIDQSYELYGIKEGKKVCTLAVCARSHLGRVQHRQDLVMDLFSSFFLLYSLR